MNEQHERNLHLRGRLRSEGVFNEAFERQLEVPWRISGLLLQIVFFVLTLIAVGAFSGLLHVLRVPYVGVVTGAAAIVVAEVLIARRWFFSGVEAALWLSGLFSFVTELPRSGTPESFLILAAVCGIAGVRVRNPIFGAVAAIFIAVWFEERFDAGLIAALVIALFGCVALLREWRRPTTEGLWIAFALLLPIAARFMADARWQTMTIALYLAYATIVIAAAVMVRHHALFFSAMIAFGIGGAELGSRFAGTPLELRLAASGAALLGLAFFVHRTLRERTLGFVVTPLRLTSFDDVAEIGGTLALQPVHLPLEAAPAGESFGGAGASGDY
jgi:hypothetical protein